MTIEINKEFIEKQAQAFCNIFKKNLADLIKTKRNEKGITIRGLYELSGVSTTVISDLENQEYIPRLDVIMRLLYALNIPFVEVLPPNARKDDYKISEYDSAHKLVLYLSSLGLKNDAVDEVMDFIDFKDLQAKGCIHKHIK